MSYKEQPQRDTVGLRGETCFPNVNIYIYIYISFPNVNQV